MDEDFETDSSDEVEVTETTSRGNTQARIDARRRLEVRLEELKLQRELNELWTDM